MSLIKWFQDNLMPHVTWNIDIATILVILGAVWTVAQRDSVLTKLNETVVELSATLKALGEKVGIVDQRIIRLEVREEIEKELKGRTNE